MSMEDSHDSSRVPEGAERFKDERKDAFLDFTERQRVWEMLSQRFGPDWETMDRAAKEKLAKKETANIITEVIHMTGEGVWGKLSTQEKRTLFHARFIDKNVEPEKRQEAFEGKAPVVQEQFPSPDEWMKKNEQFLVGMTADEKKATYRRAYTKAFTKAREKK